MLTKYSYRFSQVSLLRVFIWKRVWKREKNKKFDRDTQEKNVLCQYKTDFIIIISLEM